MTFRETIKHYIAATGMVTVLSLPNASLAASAHPDSLMQKVDGQECLGTNRVEHLTAVGRPEKDLIERYRPDSDIVWLASQQENFIKRYGQDQNDFLKSALKAQGYNPIVGEYPGGDIFLRRTHNNNPLVVFFSSTSSSPSWGDYFQVAVYDKKMNQVYQSPKADCLPAIVHWPRETLKALIPPSCEQLRRQEHELMEWEEAIL